MADASKILLTEGDAPATPAAGIAAAYTKIDHVLYTKGSDGVEHAASGLANIVEDLTPQLGGDLDANGKKISAALSLDFSDFSELTIAAGVVTVTQTCHSVDTQADAASDDLDTINGGTNAMVVIIKAENSARTVVIKHGTGNIYLKSGSDYNLDDDVDAMILIYNGFNWMAIGDVAFLADYVAKALFDAQSVLAATADNTPAALVVAEQEVVGRLTGGNVDGIALGIADNNMVQIDAADVADDEYARFTAAGLESRTKVEVATDLKDQFPQAITDNHVLTVDDAGAADDEYARFTAAGLESRTKVEVATDLKDQFPQAITDNHVLTVDDAAAGDDDFARFTASGIEGIPAQTALSALLAAVLLENDSIKLDPALSADGTWNGVTETGTAGATLVFGNLCYFQTADSRWELVSADNAATGCNFKLGICVLAAANDGSATNMLLWGKIRADAAFPALTIGAPVYMSTTAGAVQTAAPSGTTDIVRIIGYGNTADELYFCPENDWIKLV